jgi:YVTN family beta-propeller protein
MKHRFALLLALSPCALAQAPILNAPVAPDAIYVVRTGANAGLSIVDLNGFGGGTGNPHYDPTYQVFAEGDSNYPNNPNLKLQGSLLVPPLLAPSSTLNGGSSGVFTLARDTELSDLHARDALLQPGDAMLGHPLDLVASNAPAPFGCDAGGGNLCAIGGLQQVAMVWSGTSTVHPPGAGETPVHLAVGQGNPISWAPHPNPPPIQGLPSCLSPRIRALEPTSVECTLANLLVPGDAMGVPSQGIPPTGLLANEQNAFFVGPGRPTVTIPQCPTFAIRQQIGHFLYVIDRGRHDVAVLNSNTAEVIARIPVPDPTELAMGPGIDKLAVTSRATDSVIFVDVDPRSSTFHQVVATVAVGDGPTGIAWQPDDEDVFVCNELDDSVSIVSPQTLAVRKVVSRGLSAPFAVAVGPRQTGFGLQRGVYHAWILDRAGKLTLFESGPNGPNGWGFDALIGQARMTFANPKAIQPDHRDLRGGAWIAHEGQLGPDGAPTGLGGGAVTNVVLESTTIGIVPLVPGEQPNLRGLSFRVRSSIGSDQLTGVPTDLAFDDLTNLGALPQHTPAPETARVNGKSLVRFIGQQAVRTNSPEFLFVPVRDATSGVGRAIDVIALQTSTRVDVNAHRPGVQSIRARGAQLAVDYFRQ